MDNGHNRLVAKIQHFFDLVESKRNQNEQLALIAEDKCDRQSYSILACEYQIISTVYKDIFEDFLYNGENSNQ